MIEPDLSHHAAEPVTQRILRQFGALCFLFLSALASWQWVARGHQASALVLVGVGVVIGALGMLVEAYRRKWLDDPLAILDELRSAGFRVSRRHVVRFNELIGAVARE